MFDIFLYCADISILSRYLEDQPKGDFKFLLSFFFHREGNIHDNLLKRENLIIKSLYS